jgi:spermidine synthase
MTRYLIYLLVAVAGAAVLAIELLGTRVLGPYYGVSLYLWSALITVTLLSLSLGYYLGGRWADHGATLRRLALLLIAAGFWLFLVPVAKKPLLLLLHPLGLRSAVLLGALLLFAPCLILLGMVTPYALKLQARQLDKLGRTAGSLSALSTLASVIAALLTGYWLIPAMGVNRLTMAIAAMLILSALLALILQRKGIGADSLGALGVLLLLILGLKAFQPALPPGLLFAGQSPYGEIQVIDRNDTRFLLIDGAIHTAVYPPAFETGMPYVAALDLVRFFFDRTGTMLLVGLGGGSLAKNWAAQEWAVEAIEIDPVVADMASRYFGLEPHESTVHITDGRRFLLRTEKRYETIILDAFGSSSIPFHLTTIEVFGLLRSRLTKDGVLAINVECVGWQDPLVQSLALTLRREFEQVLALPCSEPPDAVGNVLLLAANRALAFPEDWLGRPGDFLEDDYLRWSVVQRNHAWDNRYVPATQKAVLLTDDQNPSDLWSERINLAVRYKLAETFSEQPALQ